MTILSGFIKWISRQVKDDGIYAPAKGLLFAIDFVVFLPEMMAGIETGNLLKAISYSGLVLFSVVLIALMIRDSDIRRYKREQAKVKVEERNRQIEWNERQKEAHNAYREYLRDRQRDILDTKLDYMQSYYSAKIDAVKTSIEYDMRMCLKAAAMEALTSIDDISSAKRFSSGIEDAMRIFHGGEMRQTTLIDFFMNSAKDLSSEVIAAMNGEVSTILETNDTKEKVKKDGTEPDARRKEKAD